MTAASVIAVLVAVKKPAASSFARPTAAIRFYARPTLLCIDEIGYIAYDAHAADLLFEIINHRYERNSILVTTNKSFKDWNTVFPNATSIAALLDRLTHHADITIIEGTSYRVRESELEAAARQKQKSPGKPHAH